MNPRISIIIPYYKPPKLRFRKCIDSILNQSFPDFEMIIVDDGNPKDYVDILVEYEKIDSRIRVIHQENSGVSTARNQGILNAKGEYLSFIDSDDFVESSFLEKLHKAIQGNDMAICAVCEQLFLVDNAWNDRRMFFSQPARYNGLQYLNFTVNKLYRAEIIRNCNILFNSDVKLGEDALFLEQYYQHCKSIRCIPEYLYHYVPNASSAVHHYQPAYWDWEQKVITKQWEMFHQYPLSTQQEQAMIAWLFRKYKGAIYYYFDFEKNVQKLSRMIERICSHSQFEQLRNCDFSKENLHLTRNEKRILRMWLNCGEKGIFAAKRITDAMKKQLITRRLFFL